MDKKNLLILFFTFIILFSFAPISSAFDFTGYTRDINGTALDNSNATIEIYSMSGPSGPQLVTVYSDKANASGFFNVSGVLEDNDYFYKPILRKFNDTNPLNVDYIGQALPEFPFQEMQRLAQGNPINFYLKTGATINITAVNATGQATTFNYMIKDQKLGYPIDSDWENYYSQITVYLPADRNYSIMLFPNQSFPVSYDLNHSSIVSNNYKVDIVFNISETLRRVSGYALKDGLAGFDYFKIVSYLVEPGDMLFQDHPMPYNMSAWNYESDIYNETTGFFNITLPGAAMGAKIMLFATVRDGSNYYGAFENLTLNYSEDETSNFNFSLQTLLGDVTNITVDDAASQVEAPCGDPLAEQQQKVNITTKKLSFTLKNSTGSVISDFAHVELEVDYSALNGASFSWMVDVSSSNSGVFSLPIISADIKKINIFTQNYAPLKTLMTASELLNPIITLTSFNPESPDDGSFGDVFIDMLISNSTCDVPNPPAGCSLFDKFEEGDGEKNMSDFNPFKIVIGGGKISLRIRKESNNITVHYINVDMMASGPPDAAFDSSANETESGASLDAAWRFGSKGPEIYSSILVGIPYNDSIVDEGAPLSLLLNTLYDKDWNKIWNASDNPNAENYSDVAYGDYADFNQRWFNLSLGGMNCSQIDSTADCYVDNSSNMIWLSIPHFSGLGPTIKSTTVGNVTLSTDLVSVNCTNTCNITVNASNGNFTLSDNLQNLTINNTDSNGYINSFKIYRYNGTGWVFNGTNSSSYTNYNFTLYNGSDITLHRYLIEINKSNTKTTRWNFTYNISGLSNPLVLEINLTCVESWSCTDWSSCSGGTQTRTCTDSNSCTTTTDKPAESQSCSTGGNSQGGAITYILTIKEGSITSKTLRVDDKTKFKINGEEHSVTLLEIKEDSVKVEIASTPFEATLNMNETQKFDLNSDNFYELSVTLTKIIGNQQATLKFEGINETYVSEEPGEDEESSEDVAEEEGIGNAVSDEEEQKVKSSLWYYLIGALIVVVILLVALKSLRIKKKKF